jgi:zinc protease
MRRPFLILSALALVGLFTQVRGQAPTKASIFPFPVRKTTLENGLSVISIAYPSPGVIAYYTLVRTGSRNEVEKGLSGFAHFFEHMMFRGTPSYSEEAYNDELKALGANFNASTSDDWTRYYFTLPASAIEKIVMLEADRFQNLQYDEPSFQKEARAVLGEYNKSASSPFLLLNETMQDLAYTAHTYKHTTIGFLSDIKDMPNQYQYSRLFLDRWYRPENCVVVVVGDVDHQKLVALAKRYYGPWKRGGETIEIPSEPAQAEPRSKNLSWPTPTLPIVYLGYHIPAGDPANSDVAALDALSKALFGETSTLYKQLVLDEQKVATLFSDCEAKRDPGLFTIAALVRDPADIEAIRKRIEQALADAATTPLPQNELDAIKAHTRYGFAVALNSPDAVADVVCDALAVSGRVEAIQEYDVAYNALTPEDLMRVAGKYFKKECQSVVTLKPEAGR